MPTLSKLACLAVCTAAAFSTADAASLRSSAGKSLVSSLSAAHSKALQTLTTKYDCDLGAANLVGTLKKVTSKNLAAEEALTKACADSQTGYEADLAAKQGEADTLANSAPAKGDAAYSAAEKVAQDAFKDIESKHEKLVADSTSVVEAAATKQSLAQGEAALKHNERDAARALFEAQTRSANDAAEAEKSVLRAFRDSSNNAAQGIMEEMIRHAGDRKTASDSACKSVFDDRMSLVTSDEQVVSNEIKPLLDQLSACGSVSAGEDHSGSSNSGGSLLEVKAKATKTECKRAARKKLQHLQESLLQVSLNIAETPAKEVTGNMAEWESRLAKEKTFSENVRRACEEEASGILNNATAHAQNVHDKARNDANTLCSEEEAKVDAASLAHLTPLKKIADDTEGPASAAEAALKIASEDLELATARRDAAEELKISSITEAEQAKTTALEMAENAKHALIRSIMEAAETIRSDARADKEKKSTAKTDECDAGHRSFTEERNLVSQIKDKISTLTTVRDDETGEADDCAGNPCKNGGVCKDGVKSFTCTCAAGYSGVTCETDIDDCASKPCKNGGTCKDGVDSFTCTCAPGYSGDTCETNVDECASSPCKNGATCKDLVNDYECECMEGFEGKDCDINIDDCELKKACKNEAACIDGVNDYTCQCHPGWSGKDCEIDIDDCETKPCKNGASCTDKVNGYVCSCTVGFTGTNCETNVDDCAGNPCQNGGTCRDHVNAYSCTCGSDWKGSNCQEPKAPPCRTINEPRFHGGNLACDWPNVGHTLNQVCRENGYNHVKNWQRNGRRVDCYGWRGHWKHDSNPGYVRQITCCK
jgi:hypothetical protein